MENLEQLIFQLGESVGGWNSVGFEKLQTAGIPLTNLVMLLITGVLFKKNQIPYLPYNDPSRIQTDDKNGVGDLEMGNIVLQTLKDDIAKLQAEVKELKKNQSTHPGARNTEPDMCSLTSSTN